MKYKLHKQFNVNSSSARLRKPLSNEDKAMQMRNRLQAIQAKSNIGPNGKPKLKQV